MSVHLRFAGLEDAELLISFRLALLEDGLAADGALSETGRRELAETLREYFRRHFEARDIVAVVAESGGRAVSSGMLTFAEIPPSQAYPNGQVASLYNMYTLKPWRRQGLAGAVLDKLLGEAARRGACAVNLAATADGEPLYLKFGFKFSGYRSMGLKLKLGSSDG